jgi:hypothetical protein
MTGRRLRETTLAIFPVAQANAVKTEAGSGCNFLGINGNIYHAHHFGVTNSGDTIVVMDAFLKTFPTSDPNRMVADYIDWSTLSPNRAA